MTEPPLDDDEQAYRDLYDTPPNPLADHGRPAERPHLPHGKPIEDLEPL